MPRLPIKKNAIKLRKAIPRRKPLTIRKVVRQELNKVSETKYKITSVTEFAYNTIGSPSGFFTLNSIAQGDSRNARTGNAINPTFLDIRGQIQATHQEAIWYKIFLIEKNRNDDPTLDLFETDTGDVAGPSQDLRAIYQRMNNHKYKILSTRVLKTGTMSSTANDAGAVAMFHMKMPLKGKHVFDDGETVPEKKQLTLMVLGRRANNDDSLGLQFEVTFNSKFYFKDM